MISERRAALLGLCLWLVSAAAAVDLLPPAIGGVDLVISAAFIGYNVTVPANSSVSLTFTPFFDKPLLRGHEVVRASNGTIGEHRVDHVWVPPLFTTAGRDEVANSSCGNFNLTTGLFHGKRACLRAVIRKDVETNARKFIGTGNITSSLSSTPGAFVPVWYNMSGHTVTYHAHYRHDAEGFFFLVSAPSFVPVTLKDIKVTGPDLHGVVSHPDLDMPPAEAPPA